MSNYDNPSFDDHDIELDLTPPSVGAQYHPAETEDVLLTLRDMIENARDVPLSASSMISKDEVLGLVDEALESLPKNSVRRAGCSKNVKNSLLGLATRPTTSLNRLAPEQSEWCNAPRS